MTDYQRYCNALKQYPAPSLFLDLEALEKNISWVRKNSGNKKIRIATKSLRSVNILKKILACGPEFQGLMTFTLEESLWLRDLGFADILMGYPTLDQKSLELLAQDPQGITLMVDRVEHLEVIQRASQGSSRKINICIDIDLSMDLPGLRFGVYRSHLHTPQRLSDFLVELKKYNCVNLVGLMGYEAQIAGVMDTSPLIRGLKKLSLAQLHERRQKCLEVINQAGHKLEIVNGGGSGSLTQTNQESGVTEVTVGSAFFASVLFDHYDSLDLSPSLFFSLPVLRAPESGIITVLGGGYIASGPTDPIKQPLPYLPTGLKLLKHEGAGEVQTPLHTNGHKFSIGDIVIFRHAKAGEVCERFKEILVIKNDQVIETSKTYRGEGRCFL